MALSSRAASFAQQKVFALDGNPQAWLGSAVAIFDDFAIVGAKNTTVGTKEHQGAVYVFRKIRGVWRQTQILTAEDGLTGDQFGYSVAMSGELAIVTAPFATIEGKIWQGAAYAFRKLGEKWVQTQKIVGSSAAAFDTFGRIAGMSSSWAFIAAGGVTSGGRTVPYRIFAFRLVPAKSGDKWLERSILNAPEPADQNSAFGNSIAISNSMALIGSRAATVDGRVGQGAAYLYDYRSPAGWKLTARLTADDGAARDNFGVSVALDGQEVLIGAQGATIDGNVSQGAVYRFNLRREGWVQTQKILAKDGTAINLFGASVNLSKNRLLVGAYGVNSYRGAAYMFTLKEGAWQLMERLRAADGVSGDVFGYYCALSTEDALVGAYAATINGNLKQGAAYFYALPPADWSGD